MYKIFSAALFILFIPFAAHSSPEKTAKTFILHLIKGDLHSATELVSKEDRAERFHLGSFSKFTKNKPIFPSLWKVDVSSSNISSNNATVQLTVWQPEIEELIRRAGTASIVSNEFLESYLSGNPARSAISVEIDLIQEASKSWKISTNASEIAWYNETRYPPEIDVSNPNLQEILDYQEMLTSRFPDKVDGITELVTPLIASASALENAHFSNSSIIGKPNSYIEGVYEVKFTFKNNSEYTVEYLKVAVTGINSSGQIVENDDLQIFYSGSLPQGVPPHGQLIANVPLDARNANEKPVRVDLNILELKAR